MNSPIPKDPQELRKLFEQAGLGLTKSDDKQYQQAIDGGYTSPMGMTGIAPNMLLPNMDIGGGEIHPPYFNNQNVGSPPMDDAIYNDMMRDVRGSQNPFKPTNYRRDLKSNQDYENTGRDYE